jgi:hypothetical protein
VKRKALLATTSTLEVPAGVALVLTPSLAANLLLGEGLVAPAAIVVSRVAGAALIAIGAICWLGRESAGTSRRTDLIVGLLIYNLAVPMFLLHAALVLRLQGIALWPAVFLHTTLAVWCAACLAWDDQSLGSRAAAASNQGQKRG